MTTHLIILTSLDELRAKKDELVRKFSDDGNLRKYGDDSVETNDDKVFFLKVITLSEYSTKLTQAIGRGYDHVELASVIKEVERLLDNILLTKKEFVDKELSKMPPGSLRGAINSDEKNTTPGNEIIDPSPKEKSDLDDDDDISGNITTPEIKPIA